MLTSQEIREITFAGAVGGYKKDEVDVFLDSVESDYVNFEREIAQRNATIKELKEKLETFSKSQDSINNILLNAQRFADQIIDEAKAKAAEIVQNAQNELVELNEKSKAFSTEFDQVANEKKSKLEAEIAAMLNEAKDKKAYIENATAVTVKKQQELFLKLKEEMASFRTEVTNKYKEHLKLLSEMQMSAEIDPEKIAKLIEENKVKDIEEMQTQEPKEEIKEEVKEPSEAEDFSSEPPKENVFGKSRSALFIDENVFDESETEDEEDEIETDDEE